MLPKAIEWRHDGTRPPCEPSGTLFPGTPSPTLVTQTMTGSATSGAKPLKLESSESNPQLLGIDAPDEDRATYRLRQSKRAVQAGPSGSSTIRSFQHLLRSPISSRIKVKINICYNVPDELTETATRGNPPETAYPSLKLDVYQSRTDFHVPMTAYDRAEDGSERLMDPKRSITVDQRYPLDTGRIGFFTKRKTPSCLDFVLNRENGSLAVHTARLWPAVISTGERSTTSTRQPISAGWGRGYTSGWEADIYAKTREVLDGIENDLWEKYGLEDLTGSSGSVSMSARPAGR